MNINLQRGQASRLLLVLAIVILVAVIITYLVMKMAQKPPAPPPPDSGIQQPVYSAQLGNIRFVFENAINRGSLLSVSQITDQRYNYYKTGISTGEKFIQVTVGAQNTGTVNTENGAWDIENIVDSEGRNFTPYEQNHVEPWLPTNNACGELLRPAFNPSPCTKIYEVSKQSTGLKIRVVTGKDNSSNNLDSGRIDSVLLDLIVK